MKTQLSPLAAAADRQLHEQGSDLSTWLADRRAEGLGLRAIAARLTVELGWIQRPVSHQTVANWMSELDA